MKIVKGKRLHLFRGKLAIYIEPKDLWVGAYVSECYIYVCPLPVLVFRWDRD